jgi:hypothetical protein
MKLTKRQWYATYLIAAFFGTVLGMTLPRPLGIPNTGRQGWVVRIYAFEEQHIVVLAVLTLIALSIFAFKERPIGPKGWVLSFAVGLCIGVILYGPASPL